ncbi:MAG TPA: hypothetical protein VLX28_17935 [Thermoanaerobaculia bacterium]|nr:hypothetical protein [Thermoanaerobaculia bacterium]
MNVQVKPLAEITQQAIEILYSELGVVETVRFLSQFTTGYGNYTEERESLFEELTLDQALAAMKKTAGPQSA